MPVTNIGLLFTVKIKCKCRTSIATGGKSRYNLNQRDDSGERGALWDC